MFVHQCIDYFSYARFVNTQSAWNVWPFTMLSITWLYSSIFLCSVCLLLRCHYSVMALLSSSHGWLLTETVAGVKKHSFSACHRLVATSRCQHCIDKIVSNVWSFVPSEIIYLSRENSPFIIKKKRKETLIVSFKISFIVISLKSG